MDVLELGAIRRMRQNHAVEHATIHILASRNRKVHLAGHTDPGGFRLYGDVPTEGVRAAVEEALERLASEPQLAVHPMCGTNIVMGGLLAAVLSLAAITTMPRRRRSESPVQALPRLLLAGTLAFVANQFAGPAVQKRLTTLPAPAGLRLAGVETQRRGRHVMHRVRLAHDHATPQ